MSLKHLVPNPEVLLRLEPEEIGGLTMELIHTGADWARHLSAGHVVTEANPYPPEYREAIKEAIVEGWSWLENEGLISRYRPDENNRDLCFVTRRGRTMRTRGDVALYRKASLLPKELLHRRIVEKVWTLFVRGDYDTAVFQALERSRSPSATLVVGPRTGTTAQT